ncbi:MAG: NAD-dependent epimerase/dehydratase family protein [Planctomycetota bacterium]
MRILIAGACGFVGLTIAKYLSGAFAGCGNQFELTGVDNLSREGSEHNRRALIDSGAEFIHADLRMASDLESFPEVDWVIDAAAKPSVLAGVNGTSSRQLVQHNLDSTINLLEYCKKNHSGFVLLSTSRVYSIEELCSIPVLQHNDGFRINTFEKLPYGVSAQGVSEDFSVRPPVSLYGTSKLASEQFALEYGSTFDFPVWINRCGILAGAGQFGRIDQGILSYWIDAYYHRKALDYIGFEGRGLQTRDCLHPHDLASLLVKQIQDSGDASRRVFNVGGGKSHSFSLAQLSQWCEARFGPHEVGSDPNPRRFDIPWMIMDATRASERWGWQPEIEREAVFNEIAEKSLQTPIRLEVKSA